MFSHKEDQKRVLHASGTRLRRWVPQLLIIVLMVGCDEDLGEHLQSGRVLALHGLQGRWVGPVVAKEPNCGATTNGLMTIGEDGFGFDPFSSTAVINGGVAADGHLSGTLVREGADHRKLSLGFEGMASEPGTITGVLQSGRCRWSVTLHRG